MPLPAWLAARMRITSTTPTRAVDGSNRAAMAEPGTRRRTPSRYLAIAPLDYTEPVDTGAFYKNLLRPALEAVGLPARRRPATRHGVPAVEGVRLHDLRHTFAALQLSAGVHFMQVSKWLGHSTYTLTLDVYGD